MRSSRPWIPFALLVAVCVAPLWWVAFPPGQDLSAHLAYARILRDPTAPLFAAEYAVSTAAQPYTTTYHLLVGLGRVMPLLAALRLVHTAYVLALFAALFALARAAHPHEPRDRPPAAVYLATPLVWNPVAAMGFLPFLLVLPLVLAGAAIVLARGRWRAPALIACCLAAGSIHIYALPCLIAIPLLFALFTRERRYVHAAALAVGGSLAVMTLWRIFGELGVGGEPIAWREGWRAAIGFEALTHAFRIAWGTPTLKLTFAFYALFGPYDLGGQLVAIVGAAALFALARRHGPGALMGRERSLLKVAGGYALMAALLPWGVHVPSELTFIDLRTLTVAALLLAALLPPAAFEAGTPRVALLVFALACAANSWGAFARFSFASQPVLRLLSQVAQTERLAFLSFDGGAPGWGGQFHLTHNLPFLHVAQNGGVTPQLWGRYTAHLPIEQRRAVEAVPVWQPWELESRQLADVQALLVQDPAPNGPAREAAGFARVVPMLEPDFRTVACEGGWCLYRRVAR